MGIVSYNYVHSGHVDAGLQDPNWGRPRASQQRHSGGEQLAGNALETRSLPAEYAQNSNAGMLPRHTDIRNRHVHHADITTAHSDVVSQASLPIFPPTVTPKQSDFVPTRDIRWSVQKSQATLNDQDGLPSQASSSKNLTDESSFPNVTLKSQTTVYGKRDSKIHYQPPQILSMETPLARAAISLNTLPEEDLKRVLKLRRRVKMLRLQVQSHRALVHSKQAEKSSADEQYIKQVRIRHVTDQLLTTTDGSELKVLEDLWRQCQVARDEYGPVELELSEMEDRLEFEEVKLERAEEKLYERLRETESSALMLEQDYERESRDSSSSSQTQETEYEPIYEDYLGRLGDQDILQERLEAHYNEKTALEGEQERRRRVGVDLDANDMEFLASFSDVAESTRRELKVVSDDVERLRQKCVEQGVLDPAGTSTPQFHVPELSTPAPQVLSGSSEVEAKSELASVTSKLPQQLIPTENNEVGSRIYASYVGYGNSIDAWLLDKLRSSAMEILQLAAIVTTRLTMMDTLNWQAEALRLWFSDDPEWDLYMEEAPKGNIST